MPHQVTFHSGVTESDPSLPLSVNHHVSGSTVVGVDPGWSRDCLLLLPQNRVQQGSNLPSRFQAVTATGVIKVSQKFGPEGQIGCSDCTDAKCRFWCATDD